MIKEIKNYAIVRQMFFEDKELYSRISDDYTTPDGWNPTNYQFLGWFDGDVCKAILQIHPENSIVLIIHINIPKKYRGPDSFKMGNGLLTYLEKNCDEKFVKINAKIPVCYPDVIKFAEKNGFEKEGIDRKSYVKNKRYFDRAIMGKVLR
jgi:hypothetical protein